MEVIINEDGRTCNVCGKFKSWNNFYKKSGVSTGREARCKACRKEYFDSRKDLKKEYDKVYNIGNRDRRKVLNSQYYIDHREERLEYHREYRMDNKDKIASRKKERYNENPELYREKAREYYKNNPESYASQRKWYGESPAKFKTYGHRLLIQEDEPTETKDGYIEVKCAHCERRYIPNTRSVRNRIWALNEDNGTENRFYCSEECKIECSVYRKQTYPEGFKKPRKRECGAEIRKMVLERDNNTCQYCNKQFDEKDLIAHHENPVACSPMEQADIHNIKTACKRCHIDIHTNTPGMGYGELAKTALINEEIIETLKGEN
jgi:hypothetical protein